MICKRCKKELKKQGRHTSRSCKAELAKTPAFALPDPEDSWARVELWRWQYGTLPAADDMRPLDVPSGLRGMAAAIRQGDLANCPATGNVVAVLEYAAKIVAAGNALYLSTANKH
jgi:hypothetical protein